MVLLLFVIIMEASTPLPAAALLADEEKNMVQQHDMASVENQEVRITENAMVLPRI